MTWKENLASLKSMAEVSFSSVKPGFIPGSCKGSVCTELFSYCQVLLDVGVGWMPVLLGIISVAVPRSREFISSKPLLLLIFKGFFLG